jgi:hypothetical protein
MRFKPTNNPFKSLSVKGQNTHIIYIEVHIYIKKNIAIIVDHMCLMFIYEQCNPTQEYWINIKS